MPKIVLFGATGFTGRLCAHALVRRGLAPVLAARSQAKMDALERDLGVTVVKHVANSSDPASLSACLEAGDVLITTVGPFVIHGAAAVKGAIEKSAHYLDSTGEPGFIRRIFTEEHARAQQAGSLLVTALGYDYAPGHLAAGLALRAAGEAAVRVDVGYFVQGGDLAKGLSQGTQHSSKLAALTPGMEWIDGRLVERYSGVRVREFQVGGKSRAAISLGASEHYALPKSFPALRNVNTYLGWYGKRSYMMSRGARALAAVAKLPFFPTFAAFATRATPGASQGEGPDAATRAGFRTQVVAVAYDAQDRELEQVEIGGVNPYDFTAEILAWSAHQTLKGEILARGARGPIEAFGLDALITGFASVGLQQVHARTQI